MYKLFYKHYYCITLRGLETKKELDDS